MSDLLNVIITTYDSGDGKRAQLCRITLEMLVRRIQHDNIHWIISDDSASEVYQQHIEYIIEPVKDKLHSTFCINRRGVGASKNTSLQKAFEQSEYVLLLEDDWVLKNHLNIKEYMEVLQSGDAGMIRFGYLGGELKARLSSYNGITFWELEQGSAVYVYSGQVSLRTKHWYDVVGYHAEGLTAGEEEIEYCKRYNATEGAPKILYPAHIGCTLNAGLFDNIGLDAALSVNGVVPDAS